MGCFYKRKSEIAAMFHLAPVVYWQLCDLEEEIQDERGKYFYMFSNLGSGLRAFAKSIQSQGFLFDFSEKELYLNSPSEMTLCGLFCNR